MRCDIFVIISGSKKYDEVRTTRVDRGEFNIREGLVISVTEAEYKSLVEPKEI